MAFPAAEFRLACAAAGAGMPAGGAAGAGLEDPGGAAGTGLDDAGGADDAAGASEDPPPHPARLVASEAQIKRVLQEGRVIRVRIMSVVGNMDG